MSRLVLTPGDNELIKQAHDPFWDGPITRREVQAVFSKLGFNDSELIGMADTASLMLNFIFEKKLGANTPEALVLLRQEIEAYVEVKKAELAHMRAKMSAEANSAVANS